MNEPTKGTIDDRTFGQRAKANSAEILGFTNELLGSLRQLDESLLGTNLPGTEVAGAAEPKCQSLRAQLDDSQLQTLVLLKEAGELLLNLNREFRIG